jgi:cyclopropane fatty-acyl-phospholipid synthase-like methyltransferase
LSDDELLAIYDQQYVDQYDPHAVARLERVLPYVHLRIEDVVADFGCGNGLLAHFVGPRVAQYIGVDFSDAFIRDAERRRRAADLANVEFHRADIIAFCEKTPGRFDAAFAFDFIEHVYDDQLEQLFRAIYESLKPSGLLYLHTPNAEYFMERLRERGMLTQIEGHVAVRGAHAYARLLSECGFRDIEVRYLPHYLKVAGMFHFLGSVPLVGRFFRARLFITCRKPAEAPGGQP